MACRSQELTGPSNMFGKTFLSSHSKLVVESSNVNRLAKRMYETALYSSIFPQTTIVSRFMDFSLRKQRNFSHNRPLLKVERSNSLYIMGRGGQLVSVFTLLKYIFQLSVLYQSVSTLLYHVVNTNFPMF